MYDAERLLKGTPVPDLIADIYTQTESFMSSTEMLIWNHGEKLNWLIAVKSDHPEVKKIDIRIADLQIEKDQLRNSIETNVNQLVSLTKD